MSQDERAAWKNRVNQKGDGAQTIQSDEVPPEIVPEPSASESPGANSSGASGIFDIQKIVDEYKEISATHASRMQHSERRFRMYKQLAQLVVQGVYSSCSAVSRCPKLACLSVDRHKLADVHCMLSTCGRVPDEVPPMFRTGRGRETQLTENQREELLQFIEYHAQCSMALSVADCKRAIIMLKLENAGILDNIEDKAQAETRLDIFCHLWNIDHTWDAFRNWVQKTQHPDRWLAVRKLKNRVVEEVAACTQAVVARCIKNLEKLLQEVGIQDNEGKVVAPERLFCTDEKGLSARADNVSHGVIARHQRGKASAAAATLNWEHITLTTFVPLSGRRLFGLDL